MTGLNVEQEAALVYAWMHLGSVCLIKGTGND